jgi:chemotaxis protein methyltransferase CheR
MDDRQFKILLEALGYSFDGYRRVRKGVKKRIRRHMRDFGCPDVLAYLQRIVDSPADREACTRLLTVSISRFMRDRPLWEALETVWLPDLHRRFGPRLRAWSAGCACGEEACSLAIAHRESCLGMEAEPVRQVSILATDLNPAVLAKAREGIYPASSLREMTEDFRQRYFRPLRGGRRYLVQRALLNPICWGLLDLTSALPEQAYHIILLRNSILTYFDAPRQWQVMRRIVDRLLPGGLLLIGQQ